MSKVVSRTWSRQRLPRLVEQEGVEEAIIRLAGFPTPLPLVIIDNLSNLPAGERLSLLLRLARAPHSPISQVHFLRLVHAFRDEAPTYRRLARLTSKALLSAQGKQAFELFRTFLGWVSSEAAFWPGISDRSAASRLALVWAHAHRLYALLLPKNANPTAFGTFFAGQRRLSEELFARSSEYYADVAHPHQLLHVNFVLCGLSYAFNQRAPSYLNKALQNFLAPEKNPGIKYAYRDLARAKNHLGSFINNELRAALMSAEQSDLQEAESSQALKTLFAKGLDEANATSKYDKVWDYSHIILGDLPPYPEASQTLAQVLQKANFVELTKQDIANGMTALQSASQQVRHLEDDSAKSYFKAQLTAVSQLLASQYKVRGERDPEGALSILAESILGVCTSESAAEETVLEAKELFAQLVEAWPEVAVRLRPVTQRLVEELPPRQAKHFWPLLLQLRAER